MCDNSTVLLRNRIQTNRHVGCYFKKKIIFLFFIFQIPIMFQRTIKQSLVRDRLGCVGRVMLVPPFTTRETEDEVQRSASTGRLLAGEERLNRTNHIFLQGQLIKLLLSFSKSLYCYRSDKFVKSCYQVKMIILTNYFLC